MNSAQKILTFVFLVLFTLTFLWFPWFPSQHQNTYPFPSVLGWQPDLASPNDRSLMRVEWLWLAVVYTALFFMFKARDKK
jgi:hypothetical protein